MYSCNRSAWSDIIVGALKQFGYSSKKFAMENITSPLHADNSSARKSREPSLEMSAQQSSSNTEKSSEPLTINLMTPSDLARQKSDDTDISGLSGLRTSDLTSQSKYPVISTAGERVPLHEIKRLGWKCKPATKSWEPLQILYVILQAIIPTVICFWVNYGISIPVYRDATAPATLWFFPLPVAGDYGITIALEVLINWNVICSMQALDVLNGLIPPVHREAMVWWPAKNSKMEWWLRTSDVLVAAHSDRNLSLSARLCNHLKKSFPWMCFCYIILWPIFCGTSWALWGNANYPSFYRPQVLLGAIGAATSLITSPVWAVMTLVSIGRLVEDEEEREMAYRNFGLDGGSSVT